jgi:hypothetical protein
VPFRVFLPRSRSGMILLYGAHDSEEYLQGGGGNTSITKAIPIISK